jgi:RNA polymerase sigma-70 factor (ECF subfamily)
MDIQVLHLTTSKRRLLVTYATGSVNCGLPARAQASGSGSRRLQGWKKNARPNACGQAVRLSGTFVSVRPGDRNWEAFEEMFLASRSKFLRMAYTILRNREDAEDAVQDALLSAYVHLHAFEGRSALTTWFGRIVLNASLMVRRKWKSSQIEFIPEPSTTDDTSWMERIPGSGPDPEMSCAEEETFALIDVLLGKMSPVLRQAFTMTYFEEVSTKQAGALLGVSAATFKSRLFRARRDLMNQLQGSLAAPVRPVTHSAFFRSRTNLQTLAAKPEEFRSRGIALSALSRPRYAPVSEAPHAND